jgi:hypothetical protein
MTTKIYIFGEAGLWSNHRSPTNEFDLERDLTDFLQNAGEVIWDGDEHRGPRWNVDLLLYDDADIETWIQRLVAFLQQWGVLDRTLSFTIIRDGAGTNWEHRRIDVATK